MGKGPIVRYSLALGHVPINADLIVFKLSTYKEETWRIMILFLNFSSRLFSGSHSFGHGHRRSKTERHLHVEQDRISSQSRAGLSVCSFVSLSVFFLHTMSFQNNFLDCFWSAYISQFCLKQVLENRRRVEVIADCFKSLLLKQTRLNYSGSHLLWSLIMLSFGQCDQFDSNWPK